jgi:hypothetical protein
MACQCDEHGFKADAQPTGENILLHVTGTCTCPQTGYELSLEPGNPGINPQPDQVVLRLVESAPSVGGMVMTPTTVDFTTEISADAKRVTIRIAEGGFDIPIAWPG